VIVTSVVIDAFGQSRTEDHEHREFLKESCYICGLKEEDFIKATGDRTAFERHVNEEHNVWMYVQYFLHLWEVADREGHEPSGQEAYVLRKIAPPQANPASTGQPQAIDVEFFPQGRARVLEHASRLERRKNAGSKEVGIKSDVDDLRDAVRHTTSMLHSVMDEHLSNSRATSGVTSKKIRRGGSDGAHVVRAS